VKLQTTIRREVTVQKTPRFVQVCGKYDLPLDPTSVREWDVDIDLPDDWSVGVIVGPSMAGKTTLARELFGDVIEPGRWTWPDDKLIVDGFPTSVEESCSLLSSVGFSSPPDWKKPYRALSNGGKFRVDLARALAEPLPVLDIDEFGSFVHEQARKVAAAAAAKAARRLGKKLVGLLVHDDAVPYFEPDWVITMVAGEPVRAVMTRGLLRRPEITLKVIRANPSAWNLFRPHHYLNHKLHRAAKCFVGFAGTEPAAFTAVLPFPHATRPGWREHRTVCLPDFQGVGLGNAMSAFVASLFVATGRPYTSATSHPAMIRHRAKSPLWRMTRAPALGRPHRGTRKDVNMSTTGSMTRITAGFEYIGPPRLAEAKGFELIA
jgi:hypothetical protein